MSSNGRRYSTPEAAFDARTEPIVWDGCLIWTGSLTKGGYGKIYAHGKIVSAHRFAWEQENGPIPKGSQIDHSCYNRACVNHEHLRLASSSQNNANRSVRRKRIVKYPRGVRYDRGRYVACVIVNGENICRFGFATPEEAGIAAQELRQQHYGTFAGKNW